jgi:hypothetical protein
MLILVDPVYSGHGRQTVRRDGLLINASRAHQNCCKERLPQGHPSGIFEAVKGSVLAIFMNALFP